MQAVARRYGGLVAAYVAAAVAFWLLLIIILPQAAMVEFSLRPNLPPRQLSGPADVYTLENYRQFAGNTNHLWIAAKTMLASAFITCLALVVCYPLAFHLALQAIGRRARMLFLCLTLPFWINEILRSYSWYALLARNGLINEGLVWLGLIPDDRRVDFLHHSNLGVLLGMIYAYVLFMILPIFNAVGSLDRGQVEAARDLGAAPWRVHSRIVIPHAKGGIAFGCVLTFMAAAGSYSVPAILGGGSTIWFTELIYGRFFSGGSNWNLGSAYAFGLLIACTLFMFLMMSLFRVNFGDMKRS